jgi:hypothetical protein
MSDEIAQRYRKDRASTAAMLGFDLTKLTAAQSVRLDRAISLRILIDEMQLRQLRGEMIEVKELVPASESLERLVGSDPDATPSSSNHNAALAQLEAMLDNQIIQDQRKNGGRS